MKNIYLSVVIFCVGVVLIIGFQNLILNQPSWVLTFNISTGLLTFFSSILGFVAGGAFVLYYNSRQSEQKDEEEQL